MRVHALFEISRMFRKVSPITHREHQRQSTRHAFETRHGIAQEGSDVRAVRVPSAEMVDGQLCDFVHVHQRE